MYVARVGGRGFYYTPLRENVVGSLRAISVLFFPREKKRKWNCKVSVLIGGDVLFFSEERLMIVAKILWKVIPLGNIVSDIF